MNLRAYNNRRHVHKRYTALLCGKVVGSEMAYNKVEAAAQLRRKGIRFDKLVCV